MNNLQKLVGGSPINYTGNSFALTPTLFSLARTHIRSLWFPFFFSSLSRTYTTHTQRDRKHIYINLTFRKSKKVFPLTPGLDV